MKIINFETGIIERVLYPKTQWFLIEKTLIGHPRTPWTVKFHPTNPKIIASGCLGFQVRVWDLDTGQCLHVATLRHAIISLDFHSQGDVIAVASGNALYLWNYQHDAPRIAMVSHYTLRCVRFPPNTQKIIIGEANDIGIARGAPRGSRGAELTVTLSMSTFDHETFMRGRLTIDTRVIIEVSCTHHFQGLNIPT